MKKVTLWNLFKEYWFPMLTLTRWLQLSCQIVPRSPTKPVAENADYLAISKETKLLPRVLQRNTSEAAHEKRNQDSLCLVVTVGGDDPG